MRSLPTLALTASVGALSLALAPAASAAGKDDSVAYLAAQLEAGEGRLTTSFDGETYDDLGLTIDAVFAMSAAGSGGEASAVATDYLVANAAGYTGAGDETYAAATGKMLTFASARGLDPTDINGVDLVAQLQSLEQDESSEQAGRFSDKTAYDDYSNTLGQSFGLIGLKRAGVNPSTASVDRLLSQRCPDGGFALDFPKKGAQGAGCASDPDATSLAIQGLAAVGDRDTAVQGAADFLATQQDDVGGVGGGPTTEGSNSNSTGLAAVAFGLAGRDAARTDAVGYLDSLTFGCDTPQLAGGTAYDQASYDELAADGAGAEPDDITTRATAQALVGVTGTSYSAITVDGQAAATPTTDCDTAPAPTPDEGTQPGDSTPDDGTQPGDGTPDEGTQPGDGTPDDSTSDDGTQDEGTQDEGTQDEGTQDDAAGDPVRPGVVQTDGGAVAGSPAPLLLLGAGLGALVAGTVVTRRRVVEQRH